MSRKEIGGVYACAGPGAEIEIPEVNISMKQFTKYLKKIQNVTMAAGLFAGVAVSCMPTQSVAAASVQNLTPTPLVSFTFDDGLASALTEAAPALSAYGLTGTNYVITSCIEKTTVPNDCAADGNRTYMTWAQVAQLKAAGWEIASHTATHPQLATDGLNITQLTAELAGSQQTLRDHGYDATNIAFPYGDYNTAVLAETAKYYESARGFADTDQPNAWPYNPSLLYNQQVQTGTPALDWSLCKDMTVAGVKACVDQAITNKQWLILTFHGISDTPDTSSESYDYKTSDLEAIAAYVKQKQDASLIKSVTVADGLVRGTNLLSNGDFANGLTGWTTDDAVNITADSGTHGRYPEPTHAVSLKSGATATTDKHLFSPKVDVTFGRNYLLKNYVNLLAGGSVTFAVDEYDANGTWISWVDPVAGRTYSTVANAINTTDVNFSYTPSSAAVAKAALQVIVRGTNVNAYYDGATWLYTGEVTTLPPATKPGDLNNDGFVDETDLSTLLYNWNKLGMTKAQGDVNGDTTIDEADLSTLLFNWSK